MSRHPSWGCTGLRHAVSALNAVIAYPHPHTCAYARAPTGFVIHNGESVHSVYVMGSVLMGIGDHCIHCTHCGQCRRSATNSGDAWHRLAGQPSRSTNPQRQVKTLSHRLPPPNRRPADIGDLPRLGAP